MPIHLRVLISSTVKTWSMKAWIVMGLLGMHGTLTLQATIPTVYAQRTADWHRSEEGRRIADQVLTWQSPHGSWPKNQDTASSPYQGDPGQLRGTFDNKATTGELRFLGRAYSATQTDRYKEAFLKGFDHILDAQYASGGWPQYFPPGKGYHRHITFNDDAMVRLMIFLRDIRAESDFAFLDQDRLDAAQTAFARGIQCILDCQIMVDGQRTVWCAQHDAETLAPAKARSYELPSLSGGESAGILILLMDLEDPSPEVIRAVNAGVHWYRKTRITGFRYKVSEDALGLTPDASAPPLWARFYEIGTHRPIFCDRDGIKKYHLEAIGEERRRGYAWYTTAGNRVLQAYSLWPYR